MAPSWVPRCISRQICGALCVWRGFDEWSTLLHRHQGTRRPESGRRTGPAGCSRLRSSVPFARSHRSFQPLVVGGGRRWCPTNQGLPKGRERTGLERRVTTEGTCQTGSVADLSEGGAGGLWRDGSNPRVGAVSVSLVAHTGWIRRGTPNAEGVRRKIGQEAVSELSTKATLMDCWAPCSMRSAPRLLFVLGRSSRVNPRRPNPSPIV